MAERAKKVLKYFEEEQAFVSSRVESGIERYRKGRIRIQVKDEAGNPIPGAVISAKQTKQDFKFGANIFMLDEMETPEKNARYKELFPQVFNMATLPFYWGDVEPEQGKPRYAADSPRIYRRPAIDLCMDYCRQMGIEPKLHCLNYDSERPAWLKGKSVIEHKELLTKRFKELGERYASRIPMVEVTNETQLPYHEGSEFYYQDDFCEWSFLEAKKYFPHNELIINEAFSPWTSPLAWTNRNAYYQQIQTLLGKQIPVHGIGMQFHSFEPQEHEVERLANPYGRYSPRFLCAVMDKMEQLNLPLQITEMTIPSYSWNDEDEFVQAEIIRNVYSLFFAQRGMEAVIYWNLPDGYAYGAVPGDMSHGENIYHGGLMRFDLSEKPAMKVLKKLIREDWMTSEQLVTDESGYAELHGFYGEYELMAHAKEHSVSATIRLSKHAPLNSTCTIEIR